MKFSLSPTLISWVYVILSLSAALAANTVSAKWAGEATLLNRYLPIMLVLSPLVFITFGLTTARTGLALGSASVDSLLTITTIVVGLIFFREWKTLSVTQLMGIAAIVVGIVLTQLPKAS